MLHHSGRRRGRARNGLPERVKPSIDEARTNAHDAGAPQPEQGDEQDLPAAEWLEENGYREVSLGITPAAAMGWEPYEITAWGLITATATAGTFFVVNRKRPT